MVIGKDALAYSVYKFLVADGQKLPLSDGTDALYLVRRDVNVLVGIKADFRLLYATYEPPQKEDGKNNANGNHNAIFFIVVDMLVSFKDACIRFQCSAGLTGRLGCSAR